MIKINGYEIEKKYFPDGTMNLKFDIELSPFHETIKIDWLYEPNEEMMLYYIVKHIRSDNILQSIFLYMYYIPNARLDRTKNTNEVFTLKYFCEFINNLNFDSVIVKDAHSNVSLALLDRVISFDIIENIKDLTVRLLDFDSDIVFYPDEGSCKRYSESLKFPCAFGIKKRNWLDGEILGLDVFGKLPKQPFNVLIIDDICSYGGTFLHSAKKLKELGADKIYLYISHCENSVLDGELINSGLIEKIYTTKSIFTKTHDLIEIIGGKYE